MHDILLLVFVTLLHALQLVASIGYNTLQLSIFQRLDAHLIFSATAHVFLPLFFVLRLGSLELAISNGHDVLLLYIFIRLDALQICIVQERKFLLFLQSTKPYLSQFDTLSLFQSVQGQKEQSTAGFYNWLQLLAQPYPNPPQTVDLSPKIFKLSCFFNPEKFKLDCNCWGLCLCMASTYLSVS